MSLTWTQTGSFRTDGISISNPTTCHGSVSGIVGEGPYIDNRPRLSDNPDDFDANEEYQYDDVVDGTQAYFEYACILSG